MGFLVDRLGRIIPTQLEQKAIDMREKFVDQLKSGGQSNAFRGWLSDDNDANYDNKDLIDVRNRAKDLDDNSPIAHGAVKRITTSGISSGLRMQSQLNAKRLGLTDEEAKVRQDDLDERFHAWAAEKDSNITRQFNFYASQGLSFKSSLVFGDCFALLPLRKYPKVDNDLKFRLIEAPQCSSPVNLDNMDGTLIDGIERNKDGAITAYHFQKTHPGAENPKPEWQKIAAFGAKSGRRNVLHIMGDLDRIGQLRPRPLLSPCMEEIKQITRYGSYEVMAALLNASMTIFLNQQTPTVAGMPTPIGSNEQVTNDTVTDADGKTERDNKYEIRSGNIIEGEADDKVTIVDPKRPNVNFEKFVLAMSAQIGAAIEVPQDILMLLFSKSYTASRAAMIELWKMIFGKRANFVDYYCQPVYESWFEMEILSGRVSAKNFFANNLIRRAWLGSRWIGRGQKLLDPVKERMGQKLGIEWMLDDFENIYAESNGGNWDEMMKRRKRQDATIKETGVELPTKNPAPAPGPAPKPAPKT